MNVPHPDPAGKAPLRNALLEELRQDARPLLAQVVALAYGRTGAARCGDDDLAHHLTATLLSTALDLFRLLEPWRLGPEDVYPPRMAAGHKRVVGAAWSMIALADRGQVDGTLDAAGKWLRRCCADAVRSHRR